MLIVKSFLQLDHSLFDNSNDYDDCEGDNCGHGAVCGNGWYRLQDCIAHVEDIDNSCELEKNSYWQESEHIEARRFALVRRIRAHLQLWDCTVPENCRNDTFALL